MPRKLKKAKTLSEQAKKLNEKGLIINDISACESFLSKVNYYRLSGYYLPFIDRKTDKFFNNIEFERIQAIYSFDAELRNLISYTVETIEVYLRTQLAYYNAHAYKADGYMDAKNYNAKHNHNEFIKHINKIIIDNSSTPVMKHHMTKYGGRFPIWVIIEYFSIGELSHFYRGMKFTDKVNIANSLYNVTYDTLDSWMRCLTDLRNRCAHYARLYYWIFPAIPKMPTGENYIPTRRLFAQLYMLKMLYPTTNDWNKEFLKPLERLIKRYKPYISLKHIDFPYRWKSMLTK